MQDLTNAEMREIVNRYIRNLHDRFETVRVRSMPSDQKKRLAMGMERFTSSIPDMFKAELIDWDNANVESCVDQALADSGIDTDRDSLSYQKLCRQMKIALVRFAEIEQKRQRADYSDDINEVFPVASNASEPQKTGQSKDDEPSILLSELWDQFKAEKVRRKEWRSSTLRNHTPKFKAFFQFIGDVQVNQVTKGMIRDFRALLDRLPPHFVRRGYPDLTGIMPDDLVGKHEETIDISTVGTYMVLISSMFEYAVACRGHKGG